MVVSGRWCARAVIKAAEGFCLFRCTDAVSLHDSLCSAPFALLGRCCSMHHSLLNLHFYLTFLPLSLLLFLFPALLATCIDTDAAVVVRLPPPVREAENSSTALKKKRKRCDISLLSSLHLSLFSLFVVVVKQNEKRMQRRLLSSSLTQKCPSQRTCRAFATSRSILQRRSLAEHGGYEATVDTSNLFAELARLFPCSPAYIRWRRQRLPPQQCHGEASDELPCVSAIRKDSALPRSTSPRQAITDADTHEDEDGEKEEEEGFDWRRLLLVRSLAEPLPSITPAGTRQGEAAGTRDEHHSTVCSRKGAAHKSCSAHTGLPAHHRSERHGSAGSAGVSTRELTDEGRAVQLWRRLVLGLPDSESQPQHTMTKCSDVPADDVVCWPQPAVYELYYSLRSPRDGPMHCQRRQKPLTAATVLPGRPDGNGQSPLPSTTTRSGVRAPRHCAGGRRHDDEKRSRAVARHAGVLRVGELHAIPGLPQPAPQQFPRCATQRTPPTSQSMGSGGGNDGGGDDDCVRWRAGTAELHEAALSPLLFGTVCSLDEYFALLCTPYPVQKSKPNAAEKDTVDENCRCSTAPSSCGSVQKSEVAAGQQESSVKHRSVPSALPPPSQRVSPAPVTRFPFPAFHNAEATQRGSALYFNQNWDTYETQTPWSRSSVFRGNSNAPVSTANTTDTTEVRLSVISRDRSHAPLDAAKPLTQPRSSRPCAVLSRSVPHRRGARHWGCVSANEFVPLFFPLHFPWEASEAQRDTSESVAAAARGVPAADGDDWPSLSVEAEAAMHRYGVGVLLVHQDEWVYFTLLRHTHGSGAALDGVRRGSSAAPPHVNASHHSRQSTEMRSESLSHHYCFLHPPRTVSTAELRRAAKEKNSGTEGGGQGGAETWGGRAVPRTWLVHISADAALDRAVRLLWQASQCSTQDGNRGARPTTEANDTNAIRSHRHDHHHHPDHHREASGNTHTRRDVVSSGLHGQCVEEVDDEEAEEQTAWRERIEVGDDDAGDHEQHCSTASALRTRRLRQAREAELVARYWQQQQQQQRVTAAGGREACSHTAQGTSASPSQLADLHRGSSGFGVGTANAAQQSVARQPPSLSGIAVSPFPYCTHLLRNRTWYAKPYTLAEEMKYGLVVRYREAELVVPLQPSH